MNIENFIEDFFKQYSKAIEQLSKIEKCKFAIEVYERKDDYLAIFKGSPETIKPLAMAKTANACINKLKKKYPELKSEYGVKYFPLNRKYY